MGVPMQVSFVRRVGEADRIYVTRPDGSEERWTFPTYGDTVPHDLVHLVVETVFGVRDGFWSKVANGLDPKRANAQMNRASGAEKYAAFGDLSGGLVSEALANAGWLMVERDDAAIRASVEEGCARFGVAVPELSDVRLGAVRAALAKLGARWRALVPKGALALTFDPAAPESGLAALLDG